MSIFQHIQKSELGSEIILFELDATAFNLGVFRFCPGVQNSSVISFGGNQYSPLPIEASGFEMTTSGPLPRPNVTISNINNAFTSIVENNDDLLGAVLTRIRTYDRYLDGMPDADGDAHLPLDVFELAQKTRHNKEQISWACKALMDQENKMLPGRIVTRDYCDLIYRQHDGNNFDYESATCPFTDESAGSFFDVNDNPATAQSDACSKRLTGCRARFGETAELPFGGFPGVARLRAR